MSLILKQEANANVTTPPSGSGSVFLNGSDQLTIKDSSGNTSTVPTFTATGNTSVFFNDDGALGQNANLTFAKTTNTLTLTGGNVVAGGVKTDNLYYANGNPWDLQQPAGSNTQIQFNNNDSFGASANLTFDGNNLNTTSNLNVTGNTYISGNLTVDGNVVYVNVESLSVEDPLIALGGGPNGNALTSNNGYDRGLILHNYTTQVVDAFMGWDTSNAEFAFASNVTVNSEVVTINTLGNVRANIGNFGGLLVGETPTQANFPNAKVIVSQADSGQTHSENIGLVGEAVADSGNTSTWGIGVLGEARANGATKATGVQGGGYVTNSTDSGAAVGVRGYSIQNHSGGYNIGVLGNASGSGLGNYAFYVQAGNIGSIETATTWDLTDNSIAALTFQSTGKANIFGIETTDGAEGIYTQGYLNVTGNITATAGIKTDNYYYANGSPVDFQQAGGSNTQIQFNDADAFGGSAAFTFDKTTNVVTISNGLSVTANANVGNLNSGGNIIANGNITASSAATVTFGDNTTLYSGYTTLIPAGIFHNTGSNPDTIQVSTNSLANGIAMWTNGVANSYIESTGGIEFITGATLRSNLNPTGGTTQMALTTSGLTVANTLQANIVNSSTTMNAIGNINAGNFVTTGNIQASGTIYSNTSISTIGTITSGGNMFSNANLGCETALYVGNGAGLVSGLDNPLVLTTGTGTKYVQAAIINKNANGSADWIAYANNGNSVAGWMDMGFTGATFSDANYTITGNNDGYIFSKAVGGAGLGGNLVVATGSTGTTNDIVFATGGFLTANEKMRFINASNQFYVEPTTVSTTTSTGALRVGGGVGIAGNIYSGGLISATGNITGGNLETAGTANVGKLNVTGNVTSNLLPDANVTYDLGSDTQRWKDLYLSNSSIFLGNANIRANGTSIAMSGNLTGSNISTGGLITATGNITGGNLTTAGNVNAPIMVNGGTGIYLSAGPSGYINFFTTGGDKATITDTGNIVASNLIANSTVFAVTANISGNVTGGNLVTGGLVTATGNLVTSANVVTDLIVGKTTGVTITATGTNQNINLTPTGTGTVNVGNFIISNLATPVADSDAATKKYVDDVSQGLNIHDSCKAATPTTLATITGGTITYNNGASGVGANLTTTGSFNLIDGVNVQTSGTRILVKNEANAVYNGIYTWSNATVITRATDFNSVPEVEAGDFVFVTGGTLYDNTGWVQINSPAGIGGASDVIEFTQFSGAGTYTAGTGLTLSGSQFSITNTTVSAGSYGNGDYNATFTVNGQGQLTAAANVALTPNAANLSGTTLKSTVVNSSLTSVGTLGSLGVSGAVTASTLVSNVATGTEPLTVTSTTRVSNLNVSYSNVSDYVAVTPTGVSGIYYPVFNINSFGGNAALVSNISISANLAEGSFTATTFVGALSGAATTAGTVTTAAQPNITSTGTLTSLGVSGTVTASRLVSNVAVGTAPFTVTSTTQVANLNVATAGVAGTVTSAAQPNITSVGTLSSLSVTGTVSAGTFSGSGASLTSIPGANVTGTVANATYATSAGSASTATSATTAGTVTTAAQPNITSVGTLSSLGISGTITSSAATCLTTSLSGANSANLIYASMGDNDQFRILVGATATNAGYVEIATADDGTEPIYVRQYTGVFSSLARTATLLDGSGNTSFPGSVTAGGFVQTTSLTTGASGTAGTITGNWTLGSGSKLNATYADLAEKYVADADYEPGTVLVFGGEHEVTLSTDSDSFRVAGVVTTNPAYTMNDACEGEHVATIALQGRVPVKVIGPVYKGDLLVSCGNGHAIANNIARAGTIIGKSLENFNEATGIIEVAVGRF